MVYAKKLDDDEEICLSDIPDFDEEYIDDIVGMYEQHCEENRRKRRNKVLTISAIVVGIISAGAAAFVIMKKRAKQKA